MNNVQNISIESSVEELVEFMKDSLSGNKMADLVSVDVRDKTSSMDFMIIGTGTSQRQMNSALELLSIEMKKFGFRGIVIEGKNGCDWLLMLVNNIVVHLFKPEMRAEYNLEELWTEAQKLAK